jgi:putative transposase
LIWNRHHLQQVLTRYLEHYNTGPPHRGIDLDLPVPPPVATVTTLPVKAVERVDVLGGLIHEYRRAA